MAKKDINIVSSFCGKGLELEAKLLRDFLKPHDVYCNFYHYTNVAGSQYVRADLNLFLEVMMPNVLSLSRENWYVPNCEWHNPINDRFLPQITKVLCKTRDCEKIWKERLRTDRPERVIYTGFEARDLYDEAVPRELKFLHVAGESEFKGTEAVILGWRRLPQAVLTVPPLTVVTRQKKFQDLAKDTSGVTCLERVSEEELRQLMNSHRFHLLPSAYEGFGHSLHESIGCDAEVLTTNAAPMKDANGVAQDLLVAVHHTDRRSLATMSHVDEVGVVDAVRRALALAGEAGMLPHLAHDIKARFEARRGRARQAFMVDRQAFREKFLGMVGV